MLRVRTVFTGVPGTPWYSNLYFTGTTAENASTAHDLVAGFWAAVAPLMISDIDYVVESEVLSIDPATGDAIVAFNRTAATGSGGSATEWMPLATQALIRLRTGVFVDGRRVNGRVFVGGLTEAANDYSSPTSTVITTLTTAAEGMLGIGEPPEAPALGVWTKKNGNIFPVNSVSVWEQFAVLRSRRD